MIFAQRNNERLSYPPDGGLPTQKKKFEDTISANDCLKIAIEEFKQNKKD